jgi:tRNA threonylcarbamoyladenosine biosynthesis protein TsaE
MTTRSEAETVAAGRGIGATLQAGDIVLLSGDLGAGKTAFARGIAEGLGIAGTDVSSPTFTIIQEYRGGRLPLFHADLYRLDDRREIDDLGLSEIAVDGVLVVEWAERLPRRPPQAIQVRLTLGEGDEREIEITRSA